MELETFRSLEPGWRVVRIRRHAIRQAGEHLVALELAAGAQQLPWQRLHHRRLNVRSGGRRVASEVKLLEALVEREGAEQRREVGVLQPTPREVEPLSRAERRQADARARRDTDRLLAAGEEAAEEEGTLVGELAHVDAGQAAQVVDVELAGLALHLQRAKAGQPSDESGVVEGGVLDRDGEVGRTQVRVHREPHRGASAPHSTCACEGREPKQLGRDVADFE
mmetsp:Transcript_30456/g.96120  ORF Transcript_30456/g.96120 Transcript_30456/m.96120 type:complete len:223 (-) Transcript_30456:37-705(-)